jgi:hypothetical protein
MKRSMFCVIMGLLVFIARKRLMTLSPGRHCLTLCGGIGLPEYWCFGGSSDEMGQDAVNRVNTLGYQERNGTVAHTECPRN